MRFTDLSQPYPQHTPEPLMPFAHLRDNTAVMCLMIGVFAAFLLYVQQSGPMHVFVLCALLCMNGLAGRFLFRSKSEDSAGFRAWSAASYASAGGLLMFVGSFLFPGVGPLITGVLLAVPQLAAVALAVWLILFKQRERQPVHLSPRGPAIGASLGVSLASIPALTTGSIVSGIGYVLVAVFLFSSVLLLAYDVRALLWFRSAQR